MTHNKDKGTSVGFSNFNQVQCADNEHEWVEVELSVSGDSKIVYSTCCRFCGFEKKPIDFKIKDNIEVVEKQEWEDILVDFTKSFEYQKCLVKENEFFKTFYIWIKENYIAPEKK